MSFQIATATYVLRFQLSILIVLSQLHTFSIYSMLSSISRDSALYRQTLFDLLLVEQ